jgi:hypothetical protein
MDFFSIPLDDVRLLDQVFGGALIDLARGLPAILLMAPRESRLSL